MRKIGLTGSIGSGKSTVSAMLADLGAYIVDMDKIAREIVLPRQAAWQEIVENFGEGVVGSDGSINRKVLGDIIFKKPELRILLEKITHPRIKRRAAEYIELAEGLGYAVVVLDVPLLIEVGWQDMADEIWVVYVKEATQLTRIMARDGLTWEQGMLRIKAQLSLEEKVKYADVIIDNTQDIVKTREQVRLAWNH